MQNGKIIFNNLQSLNEKELMAINTYKNGTRKDFRNIFENYFENEYESFSKFKQSLFQKAKGTSNITVSSEGNFVNALDKAFMESSIHDVETYRKFKPQFDEMFTHLGKTEKAQDMILDYIANGANIDSDEIIKANAKYFDNKLVNHGLYGFPSEMYSVKGPTDNPLQRIKSNIQDIMSDNSIELSLSSYDYMVGPIGLSGTVDASVYHTSDIRSHVDWNTGKRIYQPNNTRGTGTVDDIIDHIERGSTTDYFHKHDELIGSNFKPESLWVKEDFYAQNKEYVHSLLDEYNIKNLDLIHASENIEKINPKNIERINETSNIKTNNIQIDGQTSFIDKTGNVKRRYKYTKPTRGPKLKNKNLNNNETIPKKKYKLTKGPKLKENVTEQLSSTKRQKFKNYKKGPKLKQIIQKPINQSVEKVSTQSTKTIINTINNKATKTLPKKSLSGGGKLAIGLAVAGLVVGGIIASSDEDKKKKAKKEKNQQINNNQSLQQPIDNTYAMQMAQDISSYRYGKHMTGFVNH